MKSAEFGDVSVTVGEDHVAMAEIRLPPDNFFDAGLIEALADGYQWAGQSGARAIVLCSQGKHFCAGADFTGRSAAQRVGDGGGDPSDLYQQALRLFEAPLPVVAAVQGAAVGGGLGLACSADFRVAGPRARFCANFARIGLHQGFALSATLPAIIGQQRAWDLLYTGRRVDAQEAAKIGLADRLADEPRRPLTSSQRDRRGRPARGPGDQGDDAGRAGRQSRRKPWITKRPSRPSSGQPLTSPKESGPPPNAAPRISRAGKNGSRGRAQVRHWITENWDPDLSLREWRTRLADSGWACPAWPARRAAATCRPAWPPPRSPNSPTPASPDCPKASACGWWPRSCSSTAARNSGSGSSARR